MLVQAIVKGKVQGVFFRKTVKECADSLNVKGSVQNLPDGSVEIFAQTDSKTMDSFFKKILENPGDATFLKIEKKQLLDQKVFQRFKILY